MCFLWEEKGTPTNCIGQHVDNKINKMHEPKYSAGNSFTPLAGHMSFQIFILVGHLINLTGH